jgi:hypothetical protein
MKSILAALRRWLFTPDIEAGIARIHTQQAAVALMKTSGSISVDITAGIPTFEPDTRDIVEILYEIENTDVGAPMPRCLAGFNTWGEALASIAGRARAEIIELRIKTDDF